MFDLLIVYPEGNILECYIKLYEQKLKINLINSIKLKHLESEGKYKTQFST